MRLWIMMISLALAGTSSAEDDFPAVRDAMKQLVPDIEIDTVRAAPIEGFVEVMLGAQLVYVSADGRYLIDGQLIEVGSRRNLSEASKGEARKKLLSQIDDDQKVIFPANGETRHTVTIFTDIDCGYCRRLHQQMAEYNDLGIEVDYLFFPRAGLSSHSFEKAVSVWCAADRNAALTSAKAGEEPEPKDCPNPVESHFQLGREIGVTGTPALLAEDGTLIPGYVPPASLRVRLDSMTAAE